MHRRLTRPEINVLKFIARHQAAGMRFVLLSRRQRAGAIELYHGGLLEVWHRTYSSQDRFAPPARQSHWCLSVAGHRLAHALFTQEISPRPAAKVHEILVNNSQTQGAQ